MGFSLFSLGNGLAITGLLLAALGYAQGPAGGWIIALVATVAFPIASHYGVIADGTSPPVLGLDHEHQLKWFLGLLATSELLFFAGVYTLGEDWWGRFRELFQGQGETA